MNTRLKLQKKKRVLFFINEKFGLFLRNDFEVRER